MRLVFALFLIVLIGCSQSAETTPEADHNEEVAKQPTQDLATDNDRYAPIEDNGSIAHKTYVEGGGGVPEGWTTPRGLPHPSTIRAIVTGDINKDGEDERVVVVTTNREAPDDYGFVRELRIYKGYRGGWIDYYTSDQAILPSKGGGMMGDPFGLIEIKNGILHVNHSGGSNWRWADTYKYRWQNDDFHLIGVDNHYGKLCGEWTDVSMNCSTGKVIYEKIYEDCETGEQVTTKTEREEFSHNFKPLPTLKTIELNKTKFVTPKYEADIYY